MQLFSSLNYPATQYLFPATILFSFVFVYICILIIINKKDAVG